MIWRSIDSTSTNWSQRDHCASGLRRVGAGERSSMTAGGRPRQGEGQHRHLQPQCLAWPLIRFPQRAGPHKAHCDHQKGQFYPERHRQAHCDQSVWPAHTSLWAVFQEEVYSRTMCFRSSPVSLRKTSPGLAPTWQSAHWSADSMVTRGWDHYTLLALAPSTVGQCAQDAGAVASLYLAWHLMRGTRLAHRFPGGCRWATSRSCSAL